MSTQHSTTSAPRQTLPSQTETETAPMMFSTENEVQIEGLFTAKSDKYHV
ncbi:hypothetical protein ACFR9U_11330 [Halorientalis brevis]|uniref:Uncharacterized protein n=1 Tax=Halorientalis brevis TaxID=1126241 RepID=A0ABD6CCL3_9EURY|nr:hypothetical protein [Halorientalis brevis]